MEPVKKFVSVPWWIWNVYWALQILGADSVWDVLAGLIFLAWGYSNLQDN